MRILFVAMAESVHTSRWINQLRGLGWDVHLFPVTPARPHASMRDVTIHDQLEAQHIDKDIGVRALDDFYPIVERGWPLPRGAYRARKIMHRLFPSWRDRSWRLARTICKLKPDIIHSLEMQQAGYLTLDAKKRIPGKFPLWIYSSWGSDLFFFGKKAEHVDRIREVLSNCDLYIADCKRDIALARELGFAGRALGVFPVTGGFNTKQMRMLQQPGPVSKRAAVALKGYHQDNWAGRALVGLQAIQQCADWLRNYEIIIYLAGDNVRYAAEYVSRITGLRITVLPPSSPDEITKLMGRARVAIGVNITDGTPSSMLEAMIMGAFPIQSNTISTAEWIADGENGLLVPPEDSERISAAIRRAVTDDALVDRAAEINAQTVQQRLDNSVIQPQVVAMYESVIAETRTKSLVSQNSPAA